MKSNELFNFDIKNLNKAKYLIGLDEAGRGPGAGPVFCGALCFKQFNEEIFDLFSKINDSKKLSEKTRNDLYDLIIKNTPENLVYSIVSISVEDIEKYNISNASLLGMKKACENILMELKENDVQILVDGKQILPNFSLPQKHIIKGDANSASIAGASILAKVARDEYMKQLDLKYPQYNWAQNKGYLTKEHLDAIDTHGLCKYHRKKFLRNHFASSTQLSLIN